METKYNQEYQKNEWLFIKGNIADKKLVEEIVIKYKLDVVVNLAAHAGVRYVMGEGSG